MNVLVACEFSGVVRDAFIERGHNAVSCDLLPSETPGPHYEGDVIEYIMGHELPDLMIAHPPCTYLAVSGARWFKGREGAQQDALAFVQLLLDAPIPRIALENPVGVISTRIRKPYQYIQPWQFGHPETKKTGLWLKNLPPLMPTEIVEARNPRVHYESPGPDRWKNRSRTLTGIAAAMADQWGSLEKETTNERHRHMGGQAGTVASPHQDHRPHPLQKPTIPPPYEAEQGRAFQDEAGLRCRV